MDPITAVSNVVSSIIDRIWPDATQSAQAKAQLAQLQISGELAQMTGQLEINKTEAANTSVFVSGWRPSVGWVCSAALAFQFILAPVIEWGTALYGNPVKLPPLDTGTLISLLMALLGVGGMRTVEKLNGVARK